MREMKNSGIEWIGDIPSDWKILRTKNFYSNHKHIVGDEAENYERLALTLGGVIKRPKDDSTGLQPEAFEGYQILRENELVFKLIDLENVSTSRIGYSQYTGIVSPAYIVLSPKTAYESKFGEYYFLSMWQREIFNYMGDDGVRSSLNSKDLLNIPYPSFSLEKKKKIADFLDEKCAEIDTVIEKTKATIEEYKKLKQSVITQAVTKGIRPNRPMKDSGIEWIGKIPAEWDLRAIKTSFSVYAGATPQSEVSEFWDGDIRWITPADYKTEDKFVEIGRRQITLQGYNSCGTNLVPAGSIVFSKRAPIGSVAICKTELCTNQGCLSCVPKQRLNIEYFYFILSVLTEIFNLFGSGTTFKEISYDSFVNFRLPYPTIEEQNEIADYLDKKCSEIDELIAKKTSLLSELESYKKSLIYEYVTGKKEVK